ncbi:MAG: ATP:cob(I)alamin adenosyltransferase [Patescibacteria group bacterium]|jgi:cob(I)alamin adenosyltransferase
MKVTTKRGDGGTTDLFGGKRVPKSDPKIELIGLCDELQAILGIIKNLGPGTEEKQHITYLQTLLYRTMGEFAGAQTIPSNEIDMWVAELEEKQTAFLKVTPIVPKFVIPGTTLLEAWYQFTRTRVRSFERYLVATAMQNPSLSKYIPFFNRLSDYLFILGQAYGLSQEDAKV